MAQDSIEYRNRAAKAVVETLLDAGRRPGSNEIELDLDAAMDALCRAVFLMASTSTQFEHDREQAASMIEAFQVHVSDELAVLAAGVRAGALSPPKGPPTLRIVP